MVRALRMLVLPALIFLKLLMTKITFRGGSLSASYKTVGRPAVIKSAWR
jgi:hypothetical protein